MTMVERSLLIGSWSLHSHGFRQTDGALIPTAQEMTGRLIYSPDDSMSVLITKTPDPINILDIIAYSGRFTLEDDGIYHHIEISPNVKRIGKKEYRIPSIDGDRLILKLPPSKEGYYEVIWQRINRYAT